MVNTVREQLVVATCGPARISVKWWEGREPRLALTHSVVSTAFTREWEAHGRRRRSDARSLEKEKKQVSASFLL